MRFNLDQIGHTHLRYDGENLAENFIVRTFDMPLLPEIEAMTILIDGKAGEWFSKRKIHTRDITIGLGILNETRDLKTIMQTWMFLSDKLAKDSECRLDLGNGYYVNALLVGETPIETNGKWSITEVTFRCFDPYIYGEEHTEELIAGTSSFNVKGNCTVRPVITIKTTSTEVVLKDPDTGDQIRIQNVTSGSTLNIDMANYRCTVNGTYKAADPSVSDFWGLRPGDRKLTLTGGTGTLTYRETYL